MKILISSFYYKPHIGGVENSIHYMSKELVKLGHEVVILVSDADFSKKKRLDRYDSIDDIEIIRFKRFIPIHGLFAFLSFYIDSKRIRKRLLSYFKSNSPDLILSRHYRLIPAIGKLFNKTKQLYIVPGVPNYQERQVIEHKSNLKTILTGIYSNAVLLVIKNSFQKKSLKICNNIVFSKCVESQIMSTYGNRFSAQLLNPGVDSQRFDMNPEMRRNNKFKFLIVGRIVRDKCIDLAIKAIACNNDPNVTLSIVGDGPEKNKLIKLCDQLDVSSRVVFFEGTSEVEKFYKGADAFLMTSNRETFGQTILEAMSSGLPIVGFKSNYANVYTATSEIIKDGKNGYLADFNVKDLAECMKKIVSLTDDEYFTIVNNNREKARSKYSWSNFVNNILKQ